jgi:hypothetical protein
MKKAILALSLTAFALVATGHEAVTIGPNGGRVVYLDSTEVPNVEFIVNAESRAEIYLLDKDRQPLALDKITVEVTAGPRGGAKKLAGEARGTKYVTAAVPDGAPYFIVAQIKTGADAKALTARLNYDPKPVESGKPAYLDDSVNAHSGDNIAVPDTATGIWAEINQHQMELVENVAEKKYEAIDEVTRAYPILAKGLAAKSVAAKSGDLAAAPALVETLVKHLASVREASAARTLDAAKVGMAGIAATLSELKKLYPDEVANAKL